MITQYVIQSPEYTSCIKVFFSVSCAVVGNSHFRLSPYYRFGTFGTLIGIGFVISDFFGDPSKFFFTVGNRLDSPRSKMSERVEGAGDATRSDLP